MPTPASSPASLLAALRFAAERHRDQRRKDPTETPYVNHPLAVAEHLARVGAITDAVTLLAAILHDTLEDTDTTPEELEDAFGAEVMRTVLEVSDDKALPKEERKRLQIEHAPHLSPRAQRIKLADLTCNVADVGAQPPEDWSDERRRAYLAWAEAVIAGCRGASAPLEAAFDAALSEARRRLEVSRPPPEERLGSGMAFDIYPFTVGHARCTALKDGESEGATANAFHHGDPEAFARAAARHGVDLERITLSYTCLLIELGGARVLIDSGAGGALFDLLERLEIAPASIDVLVLSHAHMDHYGGHLDADGAKRFANARYLMWGDEWRHYTSEEQLARDRKRLGENFAALEQHFLPLGEHLELLDTTNPEIVPGVTAVPAPGHTHHHIAVELVSGREALLYLGDAAIHPLALERPEWGFIADVDAERAAATRKTLADRALARDALVMGYHFPFPGLGKLWHQRDALVWGPRRVEAEYLEPEGVPAPADGGGSADGDGDAADGDPTP